MDKGVRFVYFKPLGLMWPIWSTCGQILDWQCQCGHTLDHVDYTLMDSGLDNVLIKCN